MDRDDEQDGRRGEGSTPVVPVDSQVAESELSAVESVLWHSWGRARHRLTREIDEAMDAATGLSMAEFAALNILYLSPESRARLSDIAARCGLTQSRISRLADTLIRHGLTHRDRDHTDGRGTYLVLTEAGRERRDKAKAVQNRLARHFVLNHIPSEHLELFAQVITDISRTEPPGLSAPAGPAQPSA